MLTTGTLPGTPNGTTLERAVGGQIPNINGLNPSVDTSTTITLFTAEITIADDATGGTILVSASHAENGGVLIYPDATAGTSLKSPADSGLVVTFTPLVITLQNTKNTCQSDFNGDGVVDIIDFGRFGTAFGASVGDPTYDDAADFNNDDVIDIIDFGVFGMEFNRTDCLD